MSRATSLIFFLRAILEPSTSGPEFSTYHLTMSFSDLRKARDRRQASYVRGDGAAASTSAHCDEGKAPAVSKTVPLYTFKEGLYSALGDAFEIRMDTVMGRGVYVKSTPRDRIEAGELLALSCIIFKKSRKQT